MTVLKNHWITTLSVLAVAFLVWLSIAGLTASDPDYATEDRVAGAIAAVAALALSTGLWSLHRGRLRLAHGLIVPALLVVGMFFWLFLVPTVVALVVLYAGVVRRGLQRELAPDATAFAGSAS